MSYNRNNRFVSLLQTGKRFFTPKAKTEKIILSFCLKASQIELGLELGLFL